MSIQYNYRDNKLCEICNNAGKDIIVGRDINMSLMVTSGAIDDDNDNCSIVAYFYNSYNDKPFMEIIIDNNYHLIETFARYMLMFATEEKRARFIDLINNANEDFHFWGIDEIKDSNNPITNIILNDYGSITFKLVSNGDLIDNNTKEVCVNIPDITVYFGTDVINNETIPIIKEKFYKVFNEFIIGCIDMNIDEIISASK